MSDPCIDPHRCAFWDYCLREEGGLPHCALYATDKPPTDVRMTAPERELEADEFCCVACGTISGPHPLDGFGECPTCGLEAHGRVKRPNKPAQSGRRMPEADRG